MGLMWLAIGMVGAAYFIGDGLKNLANSAWHYSHFIDGRGVNGG